MATPDVQRRTLVVPDGTALAWYDSGGSGPPVVLANGLGGPFAAWRHQIDYLADRHRIVGWDYRGLFGSGRPPGDAPDLGIPVHVADLLCVLDAAGIEKAALVGWSMGVQVLLELYGRRPERVSHLLLVNGTYGRPFDTVALPAAGRIPLGGIIPRLLRELRRFQGIGSKVLGRATRSPELVLWLKRLGLVGATLDEELFREIASEFGRIDLDLYLRMLEALGDHDAADVLDRIEVPTLVVSGERDPLTPHALAQQMAHRVPRGEILVVRGATHYVPLEYPELLNLRIEKFLREHGY